MLKTFIRTTACLAVSAAAFIVVTKMDATAARPRSSSIPEATEPKPAKPAPSKSTPPAPAPPAPKMTTASLKLPASTAAMAKPATTASSGKADRDSTLTIPDWKGKRLSVARREARKLGLNVTAVDESGEAVPADMAGAYRVRRMLTAAGTAAEPGTDVQVRVREIVETASGY
jgi:hypothetical protein